MNDHTATILEKSGMFAVFAIDKGESPTVYVGRFDGRCTPTHFHQTAEKFEDAAELLKVNLNISQSRGWKISYQGKRIYG